MHDVHRDSLILKKDKKKKTHQQSHGHQNNEDHGHHHGDTHPHEPQRHEDSDHDDHMHAYDATQETDHEHMHEHGTRAHNHKHSHSVSGIDGHVHGEPHPHEHEDDHHHENHEHADDHHHEDHDHDDHQDAAPHGHKHDHDAAAYEEHESDLHTHPHALREFEDRAFVHVHDHGHEFYHAHHHSHHPEHTTLVHKVFKDPARDWFALACMGLLVLAGYFKLLPGYLSDGAILCAAVIGIFPVCKNALFDCISKRKLTFELFAAMLLLLGICTGYFLEVALMTSFLLAGSFMRLNFSWRNE